MATNQEEVEQHILSQKAYDAIHEIKGKIDLLPEFDRGLRDNFWGRSDSSGHKHDAINFQFGRFNYHVTFNGEPLSPKNETHVASLRLGLWRVTNIYGMDDPRRVIGRLDLYSSFIEDRNRKVRSFRFGSADLENDKAEGIDVFDHISKVFPDLYEVVML